MKLSRPLLLSFIVSSLLLLSGPSRAAETPLPVVIAMPGPGAAPFLPLELIPKIGADRKMGISLSFHYFGGGPLAVKDLAEKNSDFAGLALAALGGLSLKHENLRSVVPLTQAPAYTLMVRSSLKNTVRKVSDLKGHTIGVHSGSKAGKSTGQQLTEFLLSGSGLSLEQVNFVPGGQSENEYRATLVSGTADAIMTNEPFASLLEQEGIAYRLVDLHDPKVAKTWLGGPFLYTQLATRKDIIESEPEKVRRVVRAIQYTLKWIDTHRPEQIVEAIAPPEEKRAAMLVFLKKNKHVYNAKGTFSDLQVRTSETFFHRVSQDNPAAQNVRLMNIIDPRWAGRSR